jgi:hypothetical protein
MLDLDPASGRDPLDDLRRSTTELAAYSSALAERPQLVVANKADLVDGVPRPPRRSSGCSSTAWRGPAVLRDLGRDGSGLTELLRAVAARSRLRMGARRQLGRVRRLVVKVGTGQITTGSTGPDRRRIARWPPTSPARGPSRRATWCW